MLELKYLNSLEKVFIDSDLTGKECSDFSCLKNEPYNIQLAFRLPADTPSKPIYVKIKTDLDISLYSVGYVPVLGCKNTNFKEQYKPGLFADILNPKKVNPEIISKRPFANLRMEKDENNNLKAHCSWQILWLCVNENQKNLKPGKYDITFEFFARQSGEPLGEATATVNVIDAKLPPQKLYYTNWFHCDCLSDFYNVEIFSDEFFRIFENFVKIAAKNGMNMILTPAFTPALDTPIGSERKKAQLVKVTYENGNYSFDFSLLKKYIDICKKCGIKYFEHSHLFTQWGAKHSPNIYCTVNGKEKRILGWETDACSKKNVKFLRQYLTALKDFLKAEKLEKKILFHISDEPTDNDAPHYKNAKNQIADLLEGYMHGDALSHYSLYADGLVQTPIVTTDHVKDFVGKCNSFWCYYTGGIQGECSNRLICNSNERNRILGMQMYCANIKGFLQWAYNYYYDFMSFGLFDPKTNPEGYNTVAGTSYSVYPANDGTALQSIRQKIFFEGINDMRALTLLEKLYGRDFVNKTIEKHYGKVDFTTQAESPEKLFNFRKDVNHLNEKASKK